MNKFISVFCWCCLIISSSLHAYDLTVVGTVSQADGLGRISIGVIDLLKNDLKINCIPLSKVTGEMNPETMKIVKHRSKTAGKVGFFCSALWYESTPRRHTRMPDCDIKISYSMLEGTSIPPEWVGILNSEFDAVVVPDEFLVEVYKNSGVAIPLFVLPLGMYLEEYFARPSRHRPASPFVFGTTVSCDERKNYALLIESFAEEFGNSDQVVLKLNSRMGAADIYKQQIQALGVTNIIFTHEVLDNNKYLDFMDSFDCFINISKGEGFSLCPREALALGIPCILTKNTAQTTICNSGLVREVPSTIYEPAYYGGLFGTQQVGYYLTCFKADVKAALRDMYTNYAFYQQQAAAGPQWVSQYKWANLKQKYLTLIKPKDIRFGNENMITDKYLMTNSPTLYKKYKRAFRNDK